MMLSSLRAGWERLAASGWIASGFLAALVFGIILAGTRAVAMGDTGLYANDIVDHLGKTPFGTGNSLWEPGHLLWRPLGWGLTTMVAPLLSRVTNWTPAMQAIATLIAVAATCSLITVILWYRLLIDVTRSARAALLLTLAMGCTHGFLLYAHSGCAYVPGLTCLTASVYFLQRSKPSAAAVFFALSALVWLPYVFAGAALLIIAGCPPGWSMSLKESLRAFSPARALRFTLISAACALVIYGAALGALHITSPALARSWFLSSNHGLSESGKVVRLATGLPRSFLYLGKDGILYRRYLKHDPYAQVAIADLVKGSLWKIASYYLFAAAFLYELLRRRQSGWALLLVATGAGPIIFFAVVLFEPGQAERYLPAFPFLVIALGLVMRDFAGSRRITQIAIGAFLLCVVLSNGYSFAASRVSREDRESLGRITALRSHFATAGMAVVVTNQDLLEDTLSRSAFADINRPRQFPLYDAVETPTSRVLTWKEEFAADTLRTWDRGGEVWVTKRAWSERPKPAWNWVEGDSDRIHWSEIPAFFSRVQTDEEEGGPDGFLRVTPSEGNRAFLKPLAMAFPQPPPPEK